MANNQGMSTVKKAEVGAGIAAGVAAAAIGAYLLYGKNGAKNRKTVKGWALKAKGEILEQVENMQNITESGYQDIINNVVASYRGAKNVSEPELMALAADARKHWKAIRGVSKPMFKQGKKSSTPSGGARKSPARQGGKTKIGSKKPRTSSGSNKKAAPASQS
jgi:hypothetical protein